AGGEVGHARPLGGGDDGGPMERAGEAVGHEGRALLMAREDEADLGRRAQHVEDRQVHRARDAEYVIDALAAKAIDDRLRACDHVSLRGCYATAIRSNMKPAFRDRSDAGRQLARMLEEYRGSAALVLAIPAGGVPVGAEIARQLGLPLDVLPVSKVLYPWTTEAGYGAVAFDGSELLDEAAIARHGVKPAQIEKAVAEARAKVERRAARLRKGRVALALEGRTLIVV